MTTPFGVACGSVAAAGAMARNASVRGDAVRFRGVWQIWIKNGKAKGILLAKIDPLDIRLQVDSRFKHGKVLYVSRAPLVSFTRENRGHRPGATSTYWNCRHLARANKLCRTRNLLDHLGFLSPPRNLTR
jgi:hypothetical protein